MSKFTARGRITAILAAGTIALAGVVASPQIPTAEAVTGSDFRAGNIISDALFYNGAAMTEAEIQGFLNQKIGACLNGRCLNVLVETVPSRDRQVSSRTGEVICEAFEGGTLSAAALIYRAQVACGISAKVILVTLHKEQGLITNRAPGEAALARAMGMACPDTAPCAPATLGFGNQIYAGTMQLKTYKAARFATQPGNNFIGYNPNAGCGGTTVFIENYATAALYAYTPYQPNAAALANLGGTGDACSSYGNRNFWVFYNNWFGSTIGAGIPPVDRYPFLWSVDQAGDFWAFPGNGKGGWLTPKKVGNGWGGFPHVFGAGDWDGDGHRDVLAVDGAGTLKLFPGDGGLGWLDPVDVAGGFVGADRVFSGGDFNRDGRPDVMSTDSQGNLYLHANLGPRGVAASVLIGWGWQGIDQLFSPGDFDGDGNPDVVGRDTSGNLNLYRGNGAGSWLGSRVIGYGWGGMTSIVGPGDFDGDGPVDVIARDAADRLWLYTGNGKGGWIRGLQIGQGWGGLKLSGPGGLALEPHAAQPGVGDVSGDGNRDVIGRTSAGDLYVYQGNGRSGWVGSSPTVRWPGMAHLFGMPDISGDGNPELMGIDSSGQLWMRSADRRGSYGAPVAVSTGWGSLNLVISAGDFDGDRLEDIIGRDTNGFLYLFPGTAAGGFGTPRVIGNGWGAIEHIFGAGDFTGDGKPDVIARGTDSHLWLYPGNGVGGWGTPTKIGSYWGAMTAIFSPGDFTGDGNPDVIARDGSGYLYLFTANGSGGLVSSLRIGNGWGGLDWIG